MGGQATRKSIFHTLQEHGSSHAQARLSQCKKHVIVTKNYEEAEISSASNSMNLHNVTMAPFFAARTTGQRTREGGHETRHFPSSPKSHPTAYLHVPLTVVPCEIRYGIIIVSFCTLHRLALSNCSCKRTDTVP